MMELYSVTRQCTCEANIAIQCSFYSHKKRLTDSVYFEMTLAETECKKEYKRNSWFVECVRLCLS